MLLRIENDNSYLDNIVFSDEVTFHLCGKINKHNCKIWGSENPHVIHEHERDTTKVNVWCGLTRNSSHWTILLHRSYSHRTRVSGHVAELCHWPTSPRIDFPARWGTAPISSTGSWLLESKFSRYVDRKRRIPCLATQVTRFDYFGFFSGDLWRICLPRRQTYNFGVTEGSHHKCSSAYNYTNATEHVAGGWIPFRCVQNHPRCTHRVAFIILQNSGDNGIKLTSVCFRNQFVTKQSHAFIN